MKNQQPISFYLLLLLSITACNVNKYDNNAGGHILILHIGNQDIPIFPVVIKAPNDTTFFQYNTAMYKGATESFDVAWRYEYTVDDQTFHQLKDYILKNNTQYAGETGSPHTYKIRMDDNCGNRIHYIVNKDISHTFLDNMADLLDPANQRELYEHLKEGKHNLSKLIKDTIQRPPSQNVYHIPPKETEKNDRE